MKHFLALILLTGLAAGAWAQSNDAPPPTDNPQTQPATQPAADPEPPVFRLGGAPPKDDGRPRPAPRLRPVESEKPSDPPPASRPAENPADPAKPETPKAVTPKPESPKSETQPVQTQPVQTQPAATMPSGPFKLGDPNVNLPKFPDPATKPADPTRPDKVATTKPDKDGPLTMKEIPFTHPDFPPGLFSDGNFYRLPDLRGKAIVLFFYDSADDRVLATIPQRNALVKKFRDKPVVFFGIENDTVHNVQRSTRLFNFQFPVFADTLGVMMSRYNVRLTTNSTWNVCIINGLGKLSHEEMTEASIEKALVGAKWRFRDQITPDPRLASALDALEMGDYERGTRIVNMWSNNVDKRVADSARAIQALIRAEADAWKVDADSLVATETTKAYDLYARIVQGCPGTDLARMAADAIKKIANHREVRPELQARAMYKVLCNAVSRDEGIEKWDAVGYCEEIIRVSPGTPTADRLVKYLDDLGKVRERNASGPKQYRRGNFNYLRVR